MPTNIPHHKLNSLEAKLLDIESYGWDGADHLSKFKRIQDCSLSRAVEAEHDDFALLLGHFLGEEVFEYVSHV